MTSAVGDEKGPVRWGMLAVISLGIMALTLNWFDVATVFPLIGSDFHVGLGSLSYLISLYIVGYGLSHIPGGMLATAIGMKRTLVLGLLVQGLAGVMSGLSYSYAELGFFRRGERCRGISVRSSRDGGGSRLVPRKDVTLALGITGGAAFSTGAAVALYVWVFVQHATGWHTSVLLAGVFELLVAIVTMVVFQVPDGALELAGAKFDLVALRTAVASRDLWVYGIALLGGYGAYFTTSQLFSEYVTQDRHFSSSSGDSSLHLSCLPGFQEACSVVTGPTAATTYGHSSSVLWWSYRRCCS